MTNESSTMNNHTYNEEEITYHVQYTEFRRNEIYYKIYWVGLTLCFGGVVPYVILIVLNTLVVRALVRNRNYNGTGRNSVVMSVKRRLSRVKSDDSDIDGNGESNRYDNNAIRIIHGVKESRRRKLQIDLAKITVTIVVIFILCHSIKWIPNIYELMVILCTFT